MPPGLPPLPSLLLSARRALLAPEHPATLGLLRVAVCAVVLASPEVIHAHEAAAAPAALRVAPEGLGWLAAHVPIDPTLARVAQLGVALGAFAGLVGYRARLAMSFVAVFGLYTFGLAQLGGAVVHDMHLVWFAAVLAASPCGDAVTLFGEARYARSVAYTIPLVAVRALFAVVYVFPGLWKLRTSGLAWALSDNLANVMRAKWFEWAWVPAFRADLHPALLHASALGVLAFELGFPLLMLTRRTRLVAVVAGLAFHFASDALLRIRFPSLWVCYVALVDWGPLAERLRARRASPSPARERPAAASRAAALVGAALVAAGVVQGLRRAVFAWPLGCYPTFDVLQSAELPDVVVDAELPDGRVVELDSGGHGRGRTQAEWARAWSVAGLTHGPATRDTLAAYVRALDRRPARGAHVARVARVTWSTVPERRDAPPVSRQLLASFALDPATADLAPGP